ncbi:peptidylprolyl isomerase [Streptosporangium lutulentum]
MTCSYRKDTSGSPAKKVGMPPRKPNTKLKTMTITTNHGAIVIDLLTAQSPCAVNSLAFLARKNFYDNTSATAWPPRRTPVWACCSAATRRPRPTARTPPTARAARVTSSTTSSPPHPVRPGGRGHGERRPQLQRQPVLDLALGGDHPA